MIGEPCDKNIIAEIPGTQIPVELFCKFLKGHQGDHVAPGTMNGRGFEITYSTTDPRVPVSK